MKPNEYIQGTLDALISELEVLIDLEVEIASMVKEYEDIKLSEVPRIDKYITIIKLLKQLKNESI
jgi:protoheme ferro-lyase